MTILFGIGVSWQVPFVVLGLDHGHGHLAPFIFIRSANPVFTSLYFMALISGIRYPLEAMKPALDSAQFFYGVTCRVRLPSGKRCSWASPICDTEGRAYLRQDIHTQTTGHQKYRLQEMTETDLEVI